MRKVMLLLVLAAFPAFLPAGEPKRLIVDNFDEDRPKLGAAWETYVDDNKLGTKVNPFEVVKEGSPKDFKGHGRFSGHTGKSKDPWPWAVLDLAFNDDGPKDLSGYKSLQFYAKGDGKKYRVRVGRVAVEDYCDFQFTFVAPKEWTLITAPLDEFKQPDGGKQIPRSFKDVNKVGFLALAPGDDEDFDLRFTNIVFVAEPRKK